MNAECQNTRELLDSFLSAELLVETNHQILRHLGHCDGCRHALAKRQRVRVLLKAALPAEAPPPDLIARLSSIPAFEPGAPAARRSGIGRWWSRLSGGEQSQPDTSRSLAGERFRQALAAAAGAIAIVLLLGAAGWLPWIPNRLSASEVLARSDRAASAMANRTDLVVHRSLRLEERRGRGGPVVARRRIEVWQNGRSGVAIRRAFDEHNSLLAGEWRERNGTRTVYRAGSPPVRDVSRLEPSRLTSDDRGDNPAWRLDLSATEYAAAIPSLSEVRVHEVGEHLVLKYEAGAAVPGTVVLEATLTLRRDTLHPVGQTVVLQREGDVREYALTEDRFFTVPGEQVAAAVFLPDAVLVPRIDPSLSPALGLPTVEPVPVVDPPAPAPAPTLEAELEVVYRLHRVNAWLREAPTVARNPDGALTVTATVDTAERREQLLAALRSVPDRGITIDIALNERWTPPAPPVPPADLHTMTSYRDLHDVFTQFIVSRVPPSQRPPIDEQQRLVDGLVRSFAARNLDRSRGALDRAVLLERTVRQFLGRQPGQLSADAEATWHTILRDYARGIAHRLEAFRLEVQPNLGSAATLSEPAADTDAPIDLAAAARELAQLLNVIDARVSQAFGAVEADQAEGPLRDPAFWRAVVGAERLSALLQEPRPLGGR